MSDPKQKLSPLSMQTVLEQVVRLWPTEQLTKLRYLCETEINARLQAALRGRQLANKSDNHTEDNHNR
jgi:hypothetical protein